jgi:predicted nucleotidyltransferase
MHEKHEKAIEIIKEELEKRGITVIKIILFGSRARGDFKEASDWDFFAEVDKDLSFQERQKVLTCIYRKLAELEDSYEIILQLENKFEKLKHFIGLISYEVDKEGVVLWTRH